MLVFVVCVPNCKHPLDRQRECQRKQTCEDFRKEGRWGASGSKQQPCTIDLFIPAPSLSLTISSSHSFHPVALLPALLLCPLTHLPILTVLSSHSCCLLLSCARCDWESHTVFVRVRALVTTLSLFFFIFLAMSLLLSLFHHKPDVRRHKN